MEYDVHSNIDARTALIVVTVTTTTVAGAIIDMGGGDGDGAGSQVTAPVFSSLEYVITSGAVNGEFSILVEDGDEPDLSDAAPVSAELVLGNSFSWNTGDTGLSGRIGIISKKRYQRMSVIVDTSGSGVFSAVAILGNPRVSPIADSTFV